MEYIFRAWLEKTPWNTTASEDNIPASFRIDSLPTLAIASILASFEDDCSTFINLVSECSMKNSWIRAKKSKTSKSCQITLFFNVESQDE